MTMTPERQPVPLPPRATDAELMELAVAVGLVNEDGESWQSRGLCRETDPEVFYPEKGSNGREALRICGDCPVRAECLDDALSRHERYGVWGGMTERDRRRLLRERGTR